MSDPLTNYFGAVTDVAPSSDETSVRRRDALEWLFRVQGHLEIVGRGYVCKAREHLGKGTNAVEAIEGCRQAIEGLPPKPVPAPVVDDQAVSDHVLLLLQEARPKALSSTDMAKKLGVSLWRVRRACAEFVRYGMAEKDHRRFRLVPGLRVELPGDVAE